MASVRQALDYAETLLAAFEIREMFEDMSEIVYSTVATGRSVRSHRRMSGL